MIYETEESAVILRWFISAKYLWNYTWRLDTDLTSSKTAGNAIQTRTLHPSYAVWLQSILEHFKDKKEIVWNGQVCPDLILK